MEPVVHHYSRKSDGSIVVHETGRTFRNYVVFVTHYRRRNVAHTVLIPV